MKAVTLRSLPPNVAEAIRKEAHRKGISLNKAVIRLLENRVGAREKKSRQTRHHDLDDLAGSWSKQKAAEFDKSLVDQRTIDPGNNAAVGRHLGLFRVHARTWRNQSGPTGS